LIIGGGGGRKKETATGLKYGAQESGSTYKHPWHVGRILLQEKVLKGESAGSMVWELAPGIIPAGLRKGQNALFTGMEARINSVEGKVQPPRKDKQEGTHGAMVMSQNRGRVDGCKLFSGNRACPRSRSS